MATKSSMLSIVIAGDPTGAQKAMGAVSKDASKMGATVAGVGSKLAGALAGAAIVQFGADAVQTYRDVGGEMLKLERLTGASEAAVSGLWVGAQQSGVAFDKLAGSIGILSSNIENGKVEALGFQVKDAQGAALSFDAVLAQIMDRFAEMENGAEKNALARSLFGRSGTDLIPLLNKGSAELDAFIDRANELGIALNADDIKAATKNQRDFALAMTATKFVVGKELLPSLTALSSIATKNLPALAQAAGTVAEAFNQLPAGMQQAIAVGIAFGPATRVLSAMGGPVGRVATGLAGAAGQARYLRSALDSLAATRGVSRTTAALEVMRSSLTQNVAEAGRLSTALAGAASFAVGLGGTLAASEWLQSQNEAGADVGRLQTSLQYLGTEFDVQGELAEKYGENLEGLAAAMERLNQSNIDRIASWAGRPDRFYGQAFDAAEEDIDQVDKALAALVASGNAEAARRAYGQLSATLIAQGVSTRDVAQAFDDYFAAQEDSALAGEEVVDVTEEETKGMGLLAQAVAAAEERYRTFGDRLNDSIGTQRDAVNALVDAQRGARDAHLATVDAQAELAEAQAAAAGDSDEMAAAIADEADAREALADAQQSELDAQLALNEAREAAADNIRDLALAAREAANDQTRAGIELQEARLELARAQADQSTTPIELQLAQLAVREAEVALAQAQAETTDANEANAQAQAQGIEGNPDVIAAKEALADAADEVASAEGRVTEANRRQATIVEEAKERVEAATRRVQDAIVDESRAWADLAGAHGDNAAAVEAQIAALERLMLQIAPGSPLRQYIAGLIGDLGQVNGLVPNYWSMPYEDFLGNYLAQGGRPEDAPAAYAAGPPRTSGGDRSSTDAKPALVLQQTINGSSLEVARRAKADGEALLDAAARLVG